MLKLIQTETLNTNCHAETIRYDICGVITKNKTKSQHVLRNSLDKIFKNLIIKNLLFVNMQQEELGKVAGIPVTSLSGI